MKKTASHVVIFRNIKTEVLLTKRADMPLWVIPGGQCEKEETSEEAAIREIREEIGVNCRLLRKVGVYTNSVHDKHLFEGTITSDANPTPSQEVTAVNWYAVNNMPFGMLNFEKRRVLDAVDGTGEILIKPFNINGGQELSAFIKKPVYLLRLLFCYFVSKF